MEDNFQLGMDNEATSLTIKDIFFKYLRFLPLFIVSIALALFVGYIYLRYATPIYTATSSLIIKSDQPLKGNDKYDQILASDNSKDIQNEIEVLKSRPLMEQVVNALNLNFSYFAQGKIKELNVYKICPFYIEAFEIADSSNSFNLIIHFINENSFTVNGEKNIFTFGQILKTPQAGVFRLVRRSNGPLTDIYRINWAPSINVASNLANAITVVPKGPTGILLISMEADNPQYCADVVNQVMDEYQALTLEDKNASNLRSKAFIDERLKVVSHELDSINNRRLQYMQANNILDAENQGSGYLNSINDASKNIQTENGQLEIIQIIENYLRDKKSNYDPVPSTLGLSDITLGGMIAGYNAALLEHNTLIASNIPRQNLIITEKEQQIEKLRQNILESLRNIRKSITLYIRESQRESDSAERLIRKLPVKQQVLEDIKRQQASKLGVYNYLMEKREESAIALASNITSSKALDRATPNPTAIRPKRQSIQLTSFFIGLLLPALFIFVLELLDDKITTRNDILRLTSAPVLGEVGHSYGKNTLMVTANNRGVIAEQFRILRSNFQYILPNVTNPVILITSSFSGEGKSFISTNMGAVLALAGKKTIILEFDIRKPKILSELHMPKSAGLTNYLLGKIKIEEIPVAVENTNNLFVFPCGPVPPNPAELLLDARLRDVFDWLKKNFDVIIMDTAPVGMVSDAMTLSEFADATLYIVRQGHTFKKQIGLIDEFHRNGKFPKISVVLNDVKIRTGYGYYGYGRYGYGKGYGYGAGYFEEEMPPPTVIDKWFGAFDLSKFLTKKKKRV